MLTAICRYGPRVLPDTRAIVRACRERGELIEGPEIRRFERGFAERLGVPDGVAASYGRVALYYLLDMPLTEVAASLGIPLGTAKSRLHYGLAAMRSAALRDPEAATAQGPGGQPA